MHQDRADTQLGLFADPHPAWGKDVFRLAERIAGWNDSPR
jgi:hypothetical protein